MHYEVDGRKVENDWTFKNANDAEILAAPADLPSSVDPRTDWWKIGDQTDYGERVGFDAMAVYY